MSDTVNKKRSLMRWGSGVAAVAALSGTVLFSSVAMSTAAQAGTLGGLTFTPPSGSDLTAPVARTSGPCPTTADSANVLIVGPVGAADPIFPEDNPYVVVTTTKASFSTSDPFDLPFRVNLKDAAADRGKTVQAGEYDVTARCVKGLTQEVLGTFTGALSFTSPTAYQTADTGTPGTSVVTTPATTSSSVPTTTTAPPTGTTSETGTTTSTPSTSTPSDSSVPTTTTAPSDSALNTAPTTGGDTTGGLPSGPNGELPTPASTGLLAKTGEPIGLIFLAGLGLLAAGLALVLVLRRRKEDRWQHDDPNGQSTTPTTGW